MRDLILAYKFGTRKNGRLSPKSGIMVYVTHATNNNNKVLLTINKFPAPQYRDDIKNVILMTQDGSLAYKADVIALERYDSGIPIPPQYTVPIQWQTETITKNMGWFALENLTQITITPGMYTSVNGKDLLKSMSGNAYMVYIQV